VNERAFAFALSHPRARWILLGFTAWDFENMDFDNVPADATVRARFDEGAKRHRLNEWVLPWHVSLDRLVPLKDFDTKE